MIENDVGVTVISIFNNYNYKTTYILFYFDHFSTGRTPEGTIRRHEPVNVANDLNGKDRLTPKEAAQQALQEMSKGFLKKYTVQTNDV